MHAVPVFIIAEIRPRRQQTTLIFCEDLQNRRRVARPPPVKKVSPSSRRRSGANKLQSVFCGGVYVAKNGLRVVSLGPKELASADPTVDVGPVSRLT